MSVTESSNGQPDRDPSVLSLDIANRFARRWCFVGAGLSNVWRFGDLDLPAASGRLLLRGPNGTGKTTALEALAPYLLDLNAARMSAGKAHVTTLSSLMREGATGKRRYGYVWLTVREPQQGLWSFGARIQFSDGASSPTKVLPFCIPARPLHDFALWGPARAALTTEQFSEAVAQRGGRVFEDEEAYVAYLATRLFNTPDTRELTNLTWRLRMIRNPTLLGDVSPLSAAAALRESLPGVAEEVISATAEALAESETTRKAFERDTQAAALLEDFRLVWCAHATDVVSQAHASAETTTQKLSSQVLRVRKFEEDHNAASAQVAEAKQRVLGLENEIADLTSEIGALEQHQSYQAAVGLADLRSKGAAQRTAANSAVELVVVTAQQVAGAGKSLEQELGNLVEDLAEHQQTVRNADAAADTDVPLLTWARQPRTVLRVGRTVADPGPEFVVHDTPATLRARAWLWQERARQHTAQAEAAAVALIDFQPVDQLQQRAEQANATAHQAAAAADTALANAQQAEATAQTEARRLREGIGVWTRIHPDLAAPLAASEDGAPAPPSLGAFWQLDDVDQLADAEPAQLLTVCNEWAHHAIVHAEQIAGAWRMRARSASTEAARLRDEARGLREEAAALRGGRLLPLPRPAWAGPGDDTVAFGAVLDWQDAFDDPAARALLEAALGAAGLLGAAMGEEGASSRNWHVAATGPMVTPNLSTFLAVESIHPLAAVASAVLARVPVASTASAAGASALCIGRDGTFQAGVLHGRVPGADDPAVLAPASHIGARQRRQAALARAATLDDQAKELTDRATAQDEQARQHDEEAAAVSAHGQAFPSRDTLHRAESDRVTYVGIAREEKDKANSARDAAERAADERDEAYGAWVERTERRGLPIVPDRLRQLEKSGGAVAAILEKAAVALMGKLAERLERAIARYAAAEIGSRLTGIEIKAQEAWQEAVDTETTIRVLEETIGAASTEILDRHKRATQHRKDLEKDRIGALRDQLESVKAQGEAAATYRDAEAQLREEIRPKAAQQLLALHELLRQPGVVDAVLDGQMCADNDVLLFSQLSTALKGRKTLTMKTVWERYDDVRSKLSGIWSLDRGETDGALFTFVLTYRDATYTPMTAAAHAQTLKVRAEHALAASEEHALHEFVLGRLPSAIGAAWLRLHDWVGEVNRKMRSAAASSGVGVQVRVPLRDDLSSAAREVYKLACTVSDAERTPEEQRRLSEALQSLLAAAPGEMQERVAAAVDIREWVEVYYEVTRPGGTKQRWSSRTGLSGGERRLVVLAPMLASIAAAYDRFGTTALRLVTLDEVPVEVDERGREGLARYLAELDLDLICTSYLWDGCPGAWDGIDAHDLEEGADRTVVAFPTLIRGVEPLPEIDSDPSGVPEDGHA